MKVLNEILNTQLGFEDNELMPLGYESEEPEGSEQDEETEED
ncbi:hypothetical protein [Shewanella sp. KX20019]|nr:hypothetical protein [Shewanella sp. KX20019]